MVSITSEPESDDVTKKTIISTSEIGATICMHAENGIVIDEIIKEAVRDGKLEPRWHALTRPTRMEAEGVHRAIAIAEVADVPLWIVHLSCSDALEQVKLARHRGVDVQAETCPQYLFLSYDNYEEPGFEGAKYVMSPPLRDKAKQHELCDDSWGPGSFRSTR